MKTIEKTYFVCEVCGKTSLVKEKVQECQQSHHRIESSTITPIYRNGVPTPTALDVVFEDGTAQRYTRTK